MPKLSVALAVFNEEKNLARCLDAIKDWAGEIVIVDGGSTDKTEEIAKRYTGKIIQTDNPPIFHINKQKSLDACTGDWILQLDADEIVTGELKEEINNILNHVTMQPFNHSDINGYYLPRKNYFLGHWLKYGGLYPDFVIRLIRKGKAHFPCRSVHEQIEVEGETGYLKNDLLHFTNNSLKDYWINSIDRYASLTADEFKGRNIFQLTIENLLINPFYWLYLRLVKNKGIFDGIYGILFSIGSALHYPLAFMKYLNQHEKNK